MSTMPMAIRVSVLTGPTDDRTGKGEHDHEPGDLRERLGFEQVIAAADHAAPQVVGVIQGRVPIEEHLAVRRLDADAGGSSGRVDLDPADRPAIRVANIDPHGLSLAAG